MMRVPSPTWFWQPRLPRSWLAWPSRTVSKPPESECSPLGGGPGGEAPNLSQQYFASDKFYDEIRVAGAFSRARLNS